MRRLTELAGALGAALDELGAFLRRCRPTRLILNETIPEAANLPSYGEPINIENAKEGGIGCSRNRRNAIGT